jgi:regulator of Ty1 transposition protein 109
MNGDTLNSDIVKRSLAVLIPSLPDDPKARFLDDLVSEGAEDPTRRHKLLKAKPDQNVCAGAGSSSSIHSSTTSPGKRKEKDPHKSRMQAENEAERRFTHATLERVSQGEYWERMGFRQECISGDVTGFFTLESSPTIESASAPMTMTMSSSSDPKPPRSALPHGIVDRILAALLNTDFKTYGSAIEHSGLWERSVKTLVIDEVGKEGYEECIAMVEGKVGEVAVPVKRKEEAPVTMLQPRKKKKVQA